MTTKTALLLAAAAVFLPFPLHGQTPSPSRSSAADQAKQLQGKWEGVEVGREGEGKCTMTIDGVSIHFEGANKEEWYKATFVLPAETDPKQLLATIVESPSPDFAGKSSRAIYKIEGGTLTLVGYKPGTVEAPKGFDDDPKARRFVFKRTQNPTNPSSTLKSN